MSHSTIAGDGANNGKFSDRVSLDSCASMNFNRPARVVRVVVNQGNVFIGATAVEHERLVRDVHAIEIKYTVCFNCRARRGGTWPAILAQRELPFLDLRRAGIGAGTHEQEFARAGLGKRTTARERAPDVQRAPGIAMEYAGSA